MIYGNVTQDPEVKKVGTEQVSVVNFCVAINSRYTTKSGEKKEEVEFVNCEAWNRQADIVGEYVKKGTPLIVQGSLKTDSWEKEGQKHYRTKVRVTRVQMTHGQKTVSPPENAVSLPEDTVEPVTEEPEVVTPKDSDIPF